MVYRHVDEIDFTPEALPNIALPTQVLLTTPEHFEVRYVINPHMAAHVGTVDTARARAQWEALREAYARIGLSMHTLPGAPNQPDMVFCANQVLPVRQPDGAEQVVLSRMAAPERTGEVVHFGRFFEGQGYRTAVLPDDGDAFEGMGDALWHPGRYLLWGGHGFRTDPGVYAYLSSLLDLPVVTLALIDPDFYHLDTCLCMLDAETAMFYPGAFDAAGRALLRRLFPRLLEAPEEESRRLFACNAHCPDRQHVIIQRGCTDTLALLRAAGFTPIETDTSEFLKAGGSVFCMKQMFW